MPLPADQTNERSSMDQMSSSCVGLASASAAARQAPADRQTEGQHRFSTRLAPAGRVWLVWA